MYTLQRDIELLALVKKTCPGGDLEACLLESIKERTRQHAQEQAQRIDRSIQPPSEHHQPAAGTTER